MLLIRHPLPLAAAAGSVLVAIHDALFFWKGVESNSHVSAMWPNVFMLLLTFWVVQDSRNHPEIWRHSFDYGLLVYVFMLPYGLYYLWRTRRARGIALTVAFTVLG